MRFREGDIVKFSKHGRDSLADVYGDHTESEGTIVTTSFMDRTEMFCIHVKWDDEYQGDLCTEDELRLVRRKDAV